MPSSSGILGSNGGTPLHTACSVRRMLFTFGSTEVTRAGTGPADLGRELRATAQIA